MTPPHTYDGDVCPFTQRELIEWATISKQTTTDVKQLTELLLGNGKPGLVKEFLTLQLRFNMLLAGVIALASPLIAILLSLVIGLLTHRIELIMH